MPVLEGCYEASSLGMIRRATASAGARVGRIIKPIPHSNGYLRVMVSIGGRRKTWQLHRLVAIAFHGHPPSDKPFVNHINGIKLDNRPQNLEWASYRENLAHAVAHGLIAHGDRVNTCKVGNEGVVEIRESHEAAARHGPDAVSECVTKAMARFGISRAAVWKIIWGYSYRRVGGPICPPSGRRLNEAA